MRFPVKLKLAKTINLKGIHLSYTNNIKVLNRVAYGYRNLQNYKNPILLHLNLKPLYKQSVQIQLCPEAV